MKKRILGILTSLALAVSMMAIGGTTAVTAASTPQNVIVVAPVAASSIVDGATFTANKAGTKGNTISVKTVLGTGNDVVLSATFSSPTLTITLPTDNSGNYNAAAAAPTHVNVLEAVKTADVTMSGVLAGNPTVGSAPTNGKHGVTITCETEGTADKITNGKTKTYKATVTGENATGTPTSYAWTSDAANAALGTTVNTDTTTLIGDATKIGATSLVCTVVQDGVTVAATGSVATEAPKATTLVVSPKTVSVQKGKTTTFTSVVKDQDGNVLADTVAYTVANGATGTAFVGAVLTVAANETNTSLTVTATSNTVNTVKDTAIVTVGAAAPAPVDPTAPQAPSNAASNIKGGSTSPITLVPAYVEGFGRVGITIAMDKISDEMRLAINKLGTSQVEAEIKKATDAVASMTKTTNETAAKDLLKKVGDANKGVELTSLNFNGKNHVNFAFPVTVTANLGLAKGTVTAPAKTFLYYMDTAKKTAVAVSVGEVLTDVDGISTFTLTHASDYFVSTKAINLSDPALGEGVTETSAVITDAVTSAPVVTEVTAPATNPSTGNAPIALLLIPAAIAAAIVIAKRK